MFALVGSLLEAARPGKAAKPPGPSPEALFKARDKNKDSFVTLKPIERRSTKVCFP